MDARPNSPERHFVQGLIQLANARLKLVMGKPKAAARLAAIAGRMSSRSLYSGSKTIMGVEVAALLVEVSWAGDAHCGGPEQARAYLHYNA